MTHFFYAAEKVSGEDTNDDGYDDVKTFRGAIAAENPDDPADTKCWKGTVTLDSNQLNDRLVHKTDDGTEDDPGADLLRIVPDHKPREHGDDYTAERIVTINNGVGEVWSEDGWEWLEPALGCHDDEPEDEHRADEAEVRDRCTGKTITVAKEDYVAGGEESQAVSGIGYTDTICRTNTTAPRETGCYRVNVFIPFGDNDAKDGKKDGKDLGDYRVLIGEGESVAWENVTVHRNDNSTYEERANPYGAAFDFIKLDPDSIVRKLDEDEGEDFLEEKGWWKEDPHGGDDSWNWDKCIDTEDE